jgi:ribosomal protein S18 acetylase RimI-like enzyme
MIFTSKNNQSVRLRRLEPGDVEKLAAYLQLLSPETQQRFGPHPYATQQITDFYLYHGPCRGYIAEAMDSNHIIAYSIIKMGYLAHDAPRLQSSGIVPDAATDCTFAPSVADEWQSCGIGNRMLHFIIHDLQTKGIKRMILWGGVQMGNTKAVNFYKRNGFRIIGQFQYQGENYDMVCDIS